MYTLQIKDTKEACRPCAVDTVKDTIKQVTGEERGLAKEFINEYKPNLQVRQNDKVAYFKVV